MLTITAIDIEDPAWRLLAPADLRAQLRTRIAQAPGAPLLRAARLHGGPVGAAVAVPHDAASGELLLVTVAPALRRQGIGARLLATIEAAAGDAGWRHLDCAWSTMVKDDAGGFGALLRRDGWPEPSVSGRNCRVPAGPTAHYLRRFALRLPACREATIPWSMTEPAQRAELADHLARHPVAPALDPFALTALNDPRFSCALVAEGRILAWFMARRVSPSLVWVSASYARPEALEAARALPLWAGMFEAMEAEAPGTIVGWDTPLSQGPMSRLLQRRELAFGGRVGTRWHAARRLSVLEALPC